MTRPNDEPLPPPPRLPKRVLGDRIYIVRPAELWKLALLSAIFGFLLGRWL